MEMSRVEDIECYICLLGHEFSSKNVAIDCKVIEVECVMHFLNTGWYL